MTSKPERVPLDHAGLLQVLEMVQDGRLSPKLAAEVILLMQETGKPLEAVMAARVGGAADD
jgi:Asp-tRNA(Asn)/Glu-tRNA(Gln) amidotransferase B subunit